MAKWYWLESGRAQGPLTTEEISYKIQSGVLKKEDVIFREGDVEWKVASGYAEFSTFWARAHQEKSAAEWVVMTQVTSSQGLPSFIQKGPFSIHQLKAALQVGELRYSDHVWKQGWKEWKRIGDVEELKLKRAKAEEPPPKPLSESEPTLFRQIDEIKKRVDSLDTAQLLKQVTEKRDYSLPVSPPVPAPGLVKKAVDVGDLKIPESAPKEIITSPSKNWDVSPSPTPKSEPLASQKEEASSVPSETQTNTKSRSFWADNPLESLGGSPAAPMEKDSSKDEGWEKTILDSSILDKAKQSQEVSRERRTHGNVIDFPGPKRRSEDRQEEQKVDVQPSPAVRIDPLDSQEVIDGAGSVPVTPASVVVDKDRARDSILGSPSKRKSPAKKWVMYPALIASILFFVSIVFRHQLQPLIKPYLQGLTAKVKELGEADGIPVEKVKEEKPILPPAPKVTAVATEQIKQELPAPAPLLIPKPAPPPKLDPSPKFTLSVPQSSDPEGPVRVLRIVALKTNSESPQLVLDTDTAPGRTIRVLIEADAGEVLDKNSVYRVINVPVKEGQAPWVDLARTKFPRGSYRVEAEIGGARAQKTFFLGDKTEDFKRELVRDRKMKSFASQTEKRNLLRGSRALEERAAEFFSELQKKKSDPGAWSRFYGGWLTKVRGAKTYELRRVSESSVDQFVFPREWLELKKLADDLEELGSNINQAVATRRMEALNPPKDVLVSLRKLKVRSGQLSLWR